MRRRSFLRNAAFAGAACGLSVSLGNEHSAQPFDPAAIFKGQKGKPVPGWGDGPVEHVTTYNPDFADKNLWIRKDNQLLAVYRTSSNQKYPYIYPLAGPKSMVSVTTESGQPWPHHRSMFFGLDRVNGGNYWQQTRGDGQILSQGVKVLEATESKVAWSDTCLWKKPDIDPIIEDERTYTIEWRCDDYYIVDFSVKLNPLQDVTVQRTNHGFFGVRVSSDLAPNGGGVLVNSEGATGQKETEGKPAKWCAYYGKRYFNSAITEGVAVFCPPKVPFENCPWFTRDYGNISPMPFNYNPGPWVFKKGEPLEALYRTVVFVGTVADVDLNGLWDEIYG
ncbi:MAG: PmoA family protein [Planctomycetia bacterium]|nr:PmoA family protein [Planctomycetia bacterium]